MRRGHQTAHQAGRLNANSRLNDSSLAPDIPPNPTPHANGAHGEIYARYDNTTRPSRREDKNTKEKAAKDVDLRAAS